MKFRHRSHDRVNRRKESTTGGGGGGAGMIDVRPPRRPFDRALKGDRALLSAAAAAAAAAEQNGLLIKGPLALARSPTFFFTSNRGQDGRSSSYRKDP